MKKTIIVSLLLAFLMVACETPSDSSDEESPVPTVPTVSPLKDLNGAKYILEGYANVRIYFRGTTGANLIGSTITNAYIKGYKEATLYTTPDPSIEFYRLKTETEYTLVFTIDGNSTETELSFNTVKWSSDGITNYGTMRDSSGNITINKVY